MSLPSTTSMPPSSAAKDSLILHSIPPELQDRIVSFIEQPSDLKALCLSCKQFRSVTTPHLYRRVVLDPSATARNAGFFTMGNAGHPHIKDLYLTSLQDADQLEQHVSANRVIRLALYCLPKDSLLGLLAPRQLVLEVETLAAIFTQQRQLHELMPGRVQQAASQLSFRIKPTLEHLRVVHMMYLDTERCLDFYSDLMARSHSGIRHISLCGTRVSHSTTGQWIALNDTVSGDGMLFKKVFNTEHGTASAKPLVLSALRSLRASNLYLARAAETWSKVIPFERLVTIELSRCSNLEKFLLWLGCHFRTHGAQLREFSCSGRSLPYRALEDVLRSFSGLQTFQINDIAGVKSRHLDFASLAAHYSTLKGLELKYALGETIASARPTLDAFDIVELVAHCHGLEELYLDFPPVSVEDIQGRNWGVYGKWIDFIAKLPKLEILHIASWPTAPFPDGVTLPSMYKAVYHTLMADCANAIQEKLDQHRPGLSSQLKLLSFGDAPSKADKAWTANGTEIAMTRLFFIRRPAWLKPSGKKSAMIEMPAREVKYYVPSFDGVSILSGGDHGGIGAIYDALTDRT
ncbi:hypothetical protein CKM354_000054000 [Cercospora kikuchii]|uniref:F-box domain-containing protein n=1 Tax=Cercospora kikuchii TaxID=84275 RepID=A0A9P3C5I6_9PEZI|nr:uncharacterized protein CKM354_000054000 [Cercospora kikuchii]GIZ37077.1 hypothetical protein CKM354_000054000 [Cercospora kikuchii]